MSAQVLPPVAHEPGQSLAQPSVTLIHKPHPRSGRWSAAVVDAALARRAEILAAVGSLPDMGASRASDLLAERFGIDVPPSVLLELDRQGLVPRSAGTRSTGSTTAERSNASPTAPRWKRH